MVNNFYTSYSWQDEEFILRHSNDQRYFPNCTKKKDSSSPSTSFPSSTMKSKKNFHSHDDPSSSSCFQTILITIKKRRLISPVNERPIAVPILPLHRLQSTSKSLIHISNQFLLKKNEFFSCVKVNDSLKVTPFHVQTKEKITND